MLGAMKLHEVKILLRLFILTSNLKTTKWVEF